MNLNEELCSPPGRQAVRCGWSDVQVLLRSLALIAFLLGGAVGSAQEVVHRTEPAASEVVPKDVLMKLFEAIKRRRFRGDPELTLKELPRDFAESALIPEKASLEAVLDWDGSSIVLFQVRNRSSKVRDEIEGLLAAAGWTPYRQGSNYGFQPYPGDRPSAYCLGENKGLGLTMSADQEEVTNVTMFIGRGARHSGCRFRDPDQIDVPFPVLYAPKGSELRQSGGSSGPRSRQQEADLTTDLSPIQLVDHFGSQLDGQGWLPQGALDFGAAAFESWIFEDPEYVP